MRHRFGSAWLIGAALAVGAAALSSCTGVYSLGIEEQWAAALRRQSLYAIFPISEDLMVGDVLLDTRNVSDDDEDAFQLTRLMRSDPDAILDALCKDRERRILVAGVRPRADGADAARSSRRDRGAFFDCETLRGVGADDPGRIDAVRNAVMAGALIGTATDADADIRLSRSAIPEATVARLTEAQLGGSGFFSAIGAQLGLSSSNAVAVTIKLSDLQSLELSPERTFELINTLLRRKTALNPGTALSVMNAKWPDGAASICLRDFEAARKMSVVILSRVEYAQSISYEFSERLTTGLRGALDVTAVSGQAPEGQTIPGLAELLAPQNTTASGAAQGQAGGSRQSSADLTALANALRATMAGAQGPSAPGAAFNLGIGTSGRLALNETYDRPMAVGAGARLEYPAEQAIVINELSDIDEVIRACSVILREQNRLKAQEFLEVIERFNEFSDDLGVARRCDADQAPDVLRPIQKHVCTIYDRWTTQRWSAQP